MTLSIAHTVLLKATTTNLVIYSTAHHEICLCYSHGYLSHRQRVSFTRVFGASVRSWHLDHTNIVVLCFEPVLFSYLVIVSLTHTLSLTQHTAILLTNALLYSQDVTTKVFFDIEIAGGDKGRVVLGLFGNDVPKTVVSYLESCYPYLITRIERAHEHWLGREDWCHERWGVLTAIVTNSLATSAIFCFLSFGLVTRGHRDF